MSRARILTVLIIALFTFSRASANYLAGVDLHDWTKEEASGMTWQIALDGKSVDVSGNSTTAAAS